MHDSTHSEERERDKDRGKGETDSSMREDTVGQIEWILVSSLCYRSTKRSAASHTFSLARFQRNVLDCPVPQFCYCFSLDSSSPAVIRNGICDG